VAAEWAEWTSKPHSLIRQQATKGAVQAAPFDFGAADSEKAFRPRRRSPKIGSTRPRSADQRTLPDWNRNKSKRLVVRSWPVRRRGAASWGDNERRFRTSWQLSNPSRKGRISRAACRSVTLPTAAWWAGMWATTRCFSRAAATNCLLQPADRRGSRSARFQPDAVLARGKAQWLDLRAREN